MKKSKKVMLTTAAFAAAFAVYSCDNTDIQDVYGPAPDLAPSAAEETTEFDPSQQEMQDVYGPPPEMSDDELVESTAKPTTSVQWQTETIGEMTRQTFSAVYGPPQDMG